MRSMFGIFAKAVASACAMLAGGVAFGQAVQVLDSVDASVTILVTVSVSVTWPGNVSDVPSATFPLETISEKLFVDYGPPFVIASVLLLVALVGAIILARQEEGE